MKLAIVGTGFVGLVTGAGFADFGLEVTCVDIDAKRISGLESGSIPFFEPGLEDLIKRHHGRGCLRFSTDLRDAIRDAQVVFITVGTPGLPTGLPDISQVEAVGRELAGSVGDFELVVVKSTVPVGTTRRLGSLIRSHRPAEIEVACNPEFLREGSALEDFMRPDRIIMGTESERGANILRAIYRPLYLIETPFVLTTLESAELVKYAANAFLATKISFINELANLCDAFQADVRVVAKALGMDRRIGPKFLHPGPGFGGSCLPKDCRALVEMARQAGLEFSLVESVLRVNDRQHEVIMRKLRDGLGSVKGKTVAVWGLSFKPKTSDIRESTAIRICQALVREGCNLRVYDPVVKLGPRRPLGSPAVRQCGSPKEAAEGADAVVLATEWNELRNLDLAEIKKVMRADVLIDSRNVYDVESVKRLGFRYFGVGRR